MNIKFFRSDINVMCVKYIIKIVFVFPNTLKNFNLKHLSSCKDGQVFPIDSVNKPNQFCVADITYIHSNPGRLALSAHYHGTEFP